MRLRGGRESKAVTLSGCWVVTRCCFPTGQQNNPLAAAAALPYASTYLQGSAGQGRCNQTRRLCRPS